MGFQGRSTYDDEELDFTPQNGYYDDDELDSASAMDGGGDRGRDRTKKSMAQRMKGLSPGNLANAYIESNFHQKNFKQPLTTRARVEEVDVQKARALLVEKKTPSQLAAMKHPFDIPLPKFRSKSRDQPKRKTYEEDEEEKEEKVEEEEPLPSGMRTLPRSWTTKNCITVQKEQPDSQVLKEHQNLVKTKSPGELAALKHPFDIPVPER